MKNKSWSRKKLTQMLYHGFIGTIADNSVEIGWILCFSLLADKSLVVSGKNNNTIWSK